ncbi:MAG: molecular chaperone DnaJ [Acidimicrobiia bacterium]
MAPQREWFDKDYYAVLGVAADASEKDITKAYRKLAKQFHPDANKGDAAAEERFKEVSAAYDVLGDTAKRKEYDDVRAMVKSGGGGAGGFGGFGPGGSGGGYNDNITFDFGDQDMGGLGDILGGLFGRKGRGGRSTAPKGPQRGIDLETELHLDFMDAVKGVTTTVRFTADASCSECMGTGAKAGTLPETCTMCAGMGNVARNQGPFSFSDVCPECGGRGVIIRDACGNCKGTGVEVRPRDVKVRIPAGVNDGQKIRVKGRGGAGKSGGPAGDLYVEVHVGADPRFGRKGNDLTVRVPVTYAEAALGADVRVPTLTEPVKVKVAPGTPSGKTVRVRGRGIAGKNGKAGDLLVTFDVVVPQEMSDAERAAVEALAAAQSGNPRSHLGV